MAEKTRMLACVCVCVCVCVCEMYHQSLRLLIGQISQAQSSGQVRFCVLFLREKKARISRTCAVGGGNTQGLARLEWRVRVWEQKEGLEQRNFQVLR